MGILGLDSIPLGGLIALAVLAPNLFYAAMPPRDVPAPETERSSLSRVMAVFEAAGRIGVFTIPFLLAIELETLQSRICAAVMSVSLAIYYVGWGRYFTRGRAFRLLYAPLAGLPIPLALAPVTYFLAAGLALRSVPLFAAAVLLAIGHLFGSARIWRSVRDRG